MQTDGASKEDLQMINTRRLVCPENSIIYERDIPDDAVYTTSNNNDRAAITDIFL